MSKEYVTREELNMLAGEIKKDIEKTSRKLEKLSNKIKGISVLNLAIQFLSDVDKNPEKFSEKELRQIAEEALQIGEMGGLILQNLNQEE